MRRYNVSFFKDLHNCDGHTFRCNQGIFGVTADTPDEAIEAAKAAFSERIGDWRLYSDAIEITEDDPRPAPQPRTHRPTDAASH